MASRIKVVIGTKEEAGLAILQGGVWHQVAEGSKSAMEALKTEYISEYPFLETSVNLSGSQIFVDLGATANPKLFHKRMCRPSSSELFRQF